MRACNELALKKHTLRLLLVPLDEDDNNEDACIVLVAVARLVGEKEDDVLDEFEEELTGLLCTSAAGTPKKCLRSWIK